MASFKSHLLWWYLRYKKFQNRKLRARIGITEQRAWIEKLGQEKKLIPNSKVESLSAHGIPAEWMTVPQSREDRVMLYLHGGGYQIGSPKSHRSLVSHLAHYTRSKVLQIDYRLAPEFPFPAGLDDTVTAFDWLCKQIDPKRIVVAGDSAGGGLALALLLKWKEEKREMPGGLVLLAPWVDLAAEPESFEKMVKKDPILIPKYLVAGAVSYAGKEDRQNPFISPLDGDLSGLPPTLIQLGDMDILLPEGKALAEKLKTEGVPTELQVWKNMVHVWHFVGPALPESGKAIQKIANFMDQRIK
ncbi:MAG: alpha/beta hydrolase [Bacteroidota bacterium]